MKPFVKYLSFDSINRTGEPATLIVPSDHEKVAAEIHPEMMRFIADHPRPRGVIRIIATSLGAREGYGANNNGDGFHEEHLLRVPHGIYLGSKPYNYPMYRTFIEFSKLFKRHQNKPHNRVYGVIPHVIYNHKMRRVEVLLDIFEGDSGDPETLDAIDRGVLPSLSMGFRCVPGDVCSICENYDSPFPSRENYCDHLRYRMNQYDEPHTHKLIYAINHNGYFFDLSLVIKPADRIAFGMKKIASTSYMDSNNYQHVFGDVSQFEQYSSKIAEETGIVETVKLLEESPDVKVVEVRPVPDHTQQESQPLNIIKILKEDPAPTFRNFGIRIVFHTDKRMPPEFLNDIATRYPLHDIMSTLIGLGIQPYPEEFQRMALVGFGNRPVADLLDADGLVFDTDGVEEDPRYDVTTGEFNDRLAEELINNNIADQRSYYAPFLAKRAVMIKQALDTGEFFKQFPIIRSLLPTRKYPEDYNERLIASGIDMSSTGAALRNPPMINDGRYVGARPKGATVKHSVNPILPLMTLAGLYVGARWLKGIGDKGPLSKRVFNNPAIAATALGATAALAWMISKAGIPIVKQAADVGTVSKLRDLLADRVFQILGGTALAYGLGMRAERKREYGIQPNIIEEGFEKRPLLGSATLALALHGIGRLAKRASDDEIVKFENAIGYSDELLNSFSIPYLDKMARMSLNKSAMKIITINQEIWK